MVDPMITVIVIVDVIIIYIYISYLWMEEIPQ